MVKYPYVNAIYRGISLMSPKKIKTTINIENDLLNEIKTITERKDTRQTDVINKILKKGLILEKEVEKQEKTKGDNFLKLAGIVTAPEPFSATEEIRKLRNREL